MKKAVSVYLFPHAGYEGPNIIKSDETGDLGMIPKYGLSDAVKSFTAQKLFVVTDDKIQQDDWILDTRTGHIACNTKNKIKEFNPEIKKVVATYPYVWNVGIISLPSVDSFFIKEVISRNGYGTFWCKCRQYDSVQDFAREEMEGGLAFELNEDGNIQLYLTPDQQKLLDSTNALGRALDKLGPDGVNRIMDSIPSDPSVPRINGTTFLLDKLTATGVDADIAKLAHDIYMNCFRAADDMNYVEQTTDIFNRIKSVFGAKQ